MSCEGIRVYGFCQSHTDSVLPVDDRKYNIYAVFGVLFSGRKRNPVWKEKSVGDEDDGSLIPKSADAFGISSTNVKRYIDLKRKKPIFLKPPGKDDEKSQDNNNEPAPASPAAIASAAILPTQMPQSVPVSPSEVVTRLAPVINAFAPYGAVDLNGMPVSVYVTDTDPEQKKSKVYEAFINNVLATAGIQIDAKETIAAYTGAIACTAANSVMTFRTVPNPGATLYVIFTDPVSGSVTYVLPKVNPDKTISFEVPFANCEFSVVNVYKK